MKGNMATQEFQEFMNGIGSMYKAGTDEMEGVEGCRISRHPRDESNGLTVFQNSEFGNLDVLIIDGAPYFLAIDCAEMLGYKRARDAVARHCRYAVKHGVPHPQNPGKTIERIFIPECDLYRLIFGSKLPAAERFETWVMEEVLPAIRKTGGYILGEERMTSDELKQATERVLNAKLGQKLNEKMDSQEMDLPTFVQMVCDGERVSWNPAQLMEKLLWRYANACCRNDIQAARRDLYNNLNEYCEICLWDRRRDAQKLDHEKGLRPMYAFLSVREESLAILFAMAMCAYNGAAIGDLIRMYC